MSTTRAKREQVVTSLGDKEYRDAFVAEHVSTGIAFQIRVMREARGWSQQDLGHRVYKAQETISQLEDPDYGRHSLTTLKRLASAFDVALIVRFVPFNELVDYAVSLSAEHLAVPSFEEDEALHATHFTRSFSTAVRSFSTVVTSYQLSQPTESEQAVTYLPLPGETQLPPFRTDQFGGDQVSAQVPELESNILPFHPFRRVTSTGDRVVPLSPAINQ